MNTSVPAFYMYELDNWNDAIDVHLTEIAKTINWLKKMLEANENTELNTEIETYLNNLNTNRDRKNLLLKDIEILESYLFENKISIGKEMITPETKKRQIDMRSRVYEAEKNYLDLMYNCNNFLSENIN